jgi:hypothetical protein
MQQHVQVEVKYKHFTDVKVFPNDSRKKSETLAPLPFSVRVEPLSVSRSASSVIHSFIQWHLYALISVSPTTLL